MAPSSTAASKSSTTQDIQVFGLYSKVTKTEIYDFFSQVAPVLAVNIIGWFDNVKCIGCVDVTYSDKETAIKARDSLNSKSLKGLTLTIMLARQKNTLTNGCSDIIVKNLDASIDSEYLRKNISAFGNTLSCKVVTDRRGCSKGYGFVRFEKEKDAQKAINKLNFYEFCGEVLEVLPCRSKKARNEEKEDTLRRTVYVKNVSEDVTYDDFVTVFYHAGRVIYGSPTGGLNGKCRGIGFVTFEIEEEAARAVEELNGHIHNDKTWIVERAWTEKLERLAALKSKVIQESGQATKLYVKNIDDSINDEKMKELFSQFGRITSCKVMLDSHGRSRGFCFVAFSSPEETSKAVNELNGRMIGSKPLYVAVSKRKGERKSTQQDCFARVSDREPVPVGLLGNAPPDCSVSAPAYPAVQEVESELGVENWTRVANFADARRICA